MFRKIFLSIFLVVGLVLPLEAANLEVTNFSYGTLATNRGVGATSLTINYNSFSDPFPTSGKFRVLVFSASCSSPASCAKREIIELNGSATTSFPISQRGNDITDSDSGTSTQSWYIGDKVWGAITAEYTHSQLQTVSELPNLTENYIWVGDSSNHPVATQNIPLVSLDESVYYTDGTDPTKKGNFELGNVATGTQRTIDFLALGTDAIEFVFDGGGSAIAAGKEIQIEVPYAATIKAATLACEVSGSIVIDIWKDTYANYRPTAADTITASAKPTLSSAIKSQDTTLTGWTTSIAAGDWLVAHVDSAATVTNCTLSLEVWK